MLRKTYEYLSKKTGVNMSGFVSVAEEAQEFHRSDVEFEQRHLEEPLLENATAKLKTSDTSCGLSRPWSDETVELTRSPGVRSKNVVVSRTIGLSSNSNSINVSDFPQSQKCSPSWNDLRFAADALSPGFSSRFVNEAQQIGERSINNNRRAYPTAQDHFIRTNSRPSVRSPSKKILTPKQSPVTLLHPLARTAVPYNSLTSEFLISGTPRVPEIQPMASVLDTPVACVVTPECRDPTSVQSVMAALHQAQVGRGGTKRSSCYLEPEDLSKRQKFVHIGGIRADGNISTPVSCRDDVSFPTVNGGIQREKRTLDLSPDNSECQLSPENKRLCLADPMQASYTSALKSQEQTNLNGRESPYSLFTSQDNSDSESDRSLESRQSNNSQNPSKTQVNGFMVPMDSCHTSLRDSERGDLGNSASPTPQDVSVNGTRSSSRNSIPLDPSPPKPTHLITLDAYRADQMKNQQRLKSMLRMIFNTEDNERERDDVKVPDTTSVTKVLNGFTTGVAEPLAISSTTTASSTLPDPSTDVSFTFTLKPSVVSKRETEIDPKSDMSSGDVSVTACIKLPPKNLEMPVVEKTLETLPTYSTSVGVVATGIVPTFASVEGSKSSAGSFGSVLSPEKVASESLKFGGDSLASNSHMGNFNFPDLTRSSSSSVISNTQSLDGLPSSESSLHFQSPTSQSRGSLLPSASATHETSAATSMPPTFFSAPVKVQTSESTLFQFNPPVSNPTVNLALGPLTSMSKNGTQDNSNLKPAASFNFIPNSQSTSTSPSLGLNSSPATSSGLFAFAGAMKSQENSSSVTTIPSDLFSTGNSAATTSTLSLFGNVDSMKSNVPLQFSTLNATPFSFGQSNSQAITSTNPMGIQASMSPSELGKSFMGTTTSTATTGGLSFMTPQIASSVTSVSPNFFGMGMSNPPNTTSSTGGFSFVDTMGGKSSFNLGSAGNGNAGGGPSALSTPVTANSSFTSVSNSSSVFSFGQPPTTTSTSSFSANNFGHIQNSSSAPFGFGQSTDQNQAQSNTLSSSSSSVPFSFGQQAIATKANSFPAVTTCAFTFGPQMAATEANSFSSGTSSTPFSFGQLSATNKGNSLPLEANSSPFSFGHQSATTKVNSFPPVTSSVSFNFGQKTVTTQAGNFAVNFPQPTTTANSMSSFSSATSGIQPFGHSSNAGNPSGMFTGFGVNQNTCVMSASNQSPFNSAGFNFSSVPDAAKSVAPSFGTQASTNLFRGSQITLPTFGGAVGANLPFGSSGISQNSVSFGGAKNAASPFNSPNSGSTLPPFGNVCSAVFGAPQQTTSTTTTVALGTASNIFGTSGAISLTSPSLGAFGSKPTSFSSTFGSSSSSIGSASFGSGAGFGGAATSFGANASNQFSSTSGGSTLGNFGGFPNGGTAAGNGDATSGVFQFGGSAGSSAPMFQFGNAAAVPSFNAGNNSAAVRRPRPRMATRKR